MVKCLMGILRKADQVDLDQYTIQMDQDVKDNG